MACYLCSREAPLVLGCGCSESVHWPCFRDAAAGAWSRCARCGLRYGGALAMLAALEWVRSSASATHEAQLLAAGNHASELASAGEYAAARAAYASVRARVSDTTRRAVAFVLDIDIALARVDILDGAYARAADALRGIVNELTLGDRSSGHAARRARGLWAEAISLDAEHSEMPEKKRQREFRRALAMFADLGETLERVRSSRGTLDEERPRIAYEIALNDARAANTLLASGDHDAALARLEQALDDTDHLGDHALVLSLRHAHGICLARLGEADDAEDEIRGVVEAYALLFSDDHPLVARAESDARSIAATR